jgi:hypothetical protein
MKLMRLAIIISLVFGFLVAVTRSTQAQNFSYTSGVQVQNLSGSTANITLSFYDTATGNLSGSPTADTIAANSSKTYFATTLPVSSGFNGSLVVSSNQPVAAISNILGNNGVASASYVGTATGNTTLLLPLLMKGNSGNDTWYNIQNTGTADANVSIAYSDGTSAGPTTIKPGAARSFFQKNETHSAAVFSAVVTSNQPVAATVIQESSAVMYAYTGFPAGNVSPVMPLINANNGGTVTGMQIQNAGSASTNVTVTYTPSLFGTTCTETQTIPGGQSRTFTLFAFANGANSTCVAGQRFVGTARVTTNSASQPLTVIVNQLRLTSPQYAEAYGAFDPNAATSTVVFPLIVQRPADFSGFSIMNVGAGATSVSCTFSGTSFTVPATNINPNQAVTILTTSAIGSNYVGSGTCTASGGGKIVGVSNQLGKVLTGDDFKVYEGVNQ